MTQIKKLLEAELQQGTQVFLQGGFSLLQHFNLLMLSRVMVSVIYSEVSSSSIHAGKSLAVRKTVGLFHVVTSHHGTCPRCANWPVPFTVCTFASMQFYLARRLLFASSQFLLELLVWAGCTRQGY